MSIEKPIDRKEFVCSDCGGRCEKLYYQDRPDCENCLAHCQAVNNRCVVQSKKTCPSCNGTGHIPLHEMIIAVDVAACGSEKHIEALIAYEKESEG